MFARLLHDPFVGGHDQQRSIDPHRASDHGANEALVTGDIDHPNHRARRQRQVCKAQLDGNAARFLFF